MSQDLEYYFENESSSILAVLTIFINDTVQFIFFSSSAASFVVIIFISIGYYLLIFVAVISIVLFLPIYFYVSKTTKRRVKSNSKKIALLRDSNKASPK